MDAATLVETAGYAGIFISVFLESGVIFALALPLPGFSLLFTASVLAASGTMEIKYIIITGLLAAITGYIFGYGTGRFLGPSLFSGKNKTYFTPEQQKKTEKFMKKYGYLALVIGRFIPLIHTATPILAGVTKMRFAPFMIVNVLGAILWVLSAVAMGYFLGQVVPFAEYLALPVVLVIAIISYSRPGRRWIKKLDDKLDNI